jgi:SOS-response transcriptional repressor LexA
MARYSLTKSQRECFEVIEQLIAEKGEGPSVRELQAALGLKSPGHVTEMLASLKERGWITYLPHKARSIVVVPQGGAPLGYQLPADLDARLRDHALSHGDAPDHALADIVALFFDELEGGVAA